MNRISDDKIESERLKAKLGSFSIAPGITVTDHLNGQTIPEYDKASDSASLAISDSATFFKRDMEQAKARETVRTTVMAAFPDAPNELVSIMYNNPQVEVWLAMLAAKEQSR